MRVKYINYRKHDTPKMLLFTNKTLVRNSDLFDNIGVEVYGL